MCVLWVGWRRLLCTSVQVCWCPWATGTPLPRRSYVCWLYRRYVTRLATLASNAPRPTPGHAWSSAIGNSIIALYASRVLRVADSQPAARAAPRSCPASLAGWVDTYWAPAQAVSVFGETACRSGSGGHVGP